MINLRFTKVAMAMGLLGAASIVHATPCEPSTGALAVVQIKPGDLFQLEQCDPPSPTAAHTITIDIKDPNPKKPVFTMKSSSMKPVKPKPGDTKLKNSLDMDISYLEKSEINSHYLITINLANNNNTTFHKEWPVTTNKTGKDKIYLKSKSSKSVSFWIVGKKLGTEPLTYNLHYITEYNGYVNEWAFDPKVRNDG